MVLSLILNDWKLLAFLQSLSNEFQTMAPCMHNRFVHVLFLKGEQQEKGLRSKRIAHNARVNKDNEIPHRKYTENDVSK